MHRTGAGSTAQQGTIDTSLLRRLVIANKRIRVCEGAAVVRRYQPM